MEEKDPLSIEESYAACFCSKLINADFMIPIFNQTITPRNHKNYVKFTYCNAEFHVWFRAIERGVRVTSNVIFGGRERTLEGDVFLDENSEEGALSKKLVKHILIDYIREGLRSVYSDSK